ncbi:LacI family DNA-binding transcriptional regulator [Leptotrichia sp. oral taxon 847]|uniref:LacI family DNA-binding transcriptional regulator n=1 Tax=Leptotrichia sp. oral taxon 847 TaxID=1785996 RepID=UPI0007680E44|nr:LacI family DNA-binding transcriptional regulator [Leptotrichia sp. oral taxon 847]AMD95250.1 LacI family transcriptional regulator [Leptotrichia sp. oral taxon 847]
MATIREVAKKAGVSITTVSRILNNDDSFNVSKITKEKVLKVIKQLNYERKKNKNRISQSNISVIKCFDEKIENEDPYFVSLKINLENMLKKKVSKVNFFDLEEIEKLIKYNEISNFSLTDAVIFIGETSKEKLKFFKSLNENIICVDVYDTDNITDYIKFDMRNSVEIVLNYIFKLNHKKIGLLVGRNKVVKNLVDFREKYFKEIMVKNGLYREEYLQIGDFSMESGYIMMKEILKLEDRPTAVFCGNDSIAMGAYKAIRENKLKIPEDVSIIGFNDLKLSQYSIPPLTTIKIDTKLIAQETVNSLIELLEGKRDYHKKVFLPIELIERESCQRI